MAAMSTLSKGSSSGGPLDRQVELFTNMKLDFQDKADKYTGVERKWRNVQFAIACILGMLPVVAGVAQLFPDKATPWITLGISVVNVLVVVCNVKLDLGERVADASMAGKGFGKMASATEMFLAQLTLGEAESSSELLILLKTVQEGIDANLSYAEIIKPRGAPESSGCGCCLCHVQL